MNAEVLRAARRSPLVAWVAAKLVDLPRAGCGIERIKSVSDRFDVRKQLGERHRLLARRRAQTSSGQSELVAARSAVVASRPWRIRGTFLADYEWDSKSLLSIVLIGLPETNQRLSIAKTARCGRDPYAHCAGKASAGDTAEYIARRLARAAGSASSSTPTHSLSFTSNPSAARAADAMAIPLRGSRKTCQ